jgi:hypothetical protein
LSSIAKERREDSVNEGVRRLPPENMKEKEYYVGSGVNYDFDMIFTCQNCGQEWLVRITNPWDFKLTSCFGGRCNDKIEFNHGEKKAELWNLTVLESS